MKSFVSFSFITLAIFNYFLLASAAPTPLAASGDTNKVVKYMNAHVHDLNPPCFYSGFTKTSKGEVWAQEILTTKWIGQKGGAPRNCLLIGEVVERSRANPDNVDWGVVSKRLAELVAGEVYVLLGETVRKDSTWLKDELPALIKNPHITNPIKHWVVGKDGEPKKV